MVFAVLYTLGLESVLTQLSRCTGCRNKVHTHHCGCVSALSGGVCIWKLFHTQCTWTYDYLQTVSHVSARKNWCFTSHTPGELDDFCCLLQAWSHSSHKYRIFPRRRVVCVLWGSRDGLVCTLDWSWQVSYRDLSAEQGPHQSTRPISIGWYNSHVWCFQNMP